MRNPRKHAFTLVELLVVIAIIALLMAVLLPSLRNARRAAMSLTCMANLKTVMTAVQFYAGDNNGTMVPAQWKGGTESNPSPVSAGYPNDWMADAFPSDMILLGQYTDPGRVAFDYSRPFNGRIPGRKSAWFCPEKVLFSWETDTVMLASYAINYNVFPDIWSATHPPTGWSASWKITTIRSPARMMSFIDSWIERFMPGYSNEFYANSYGQTGNWSAGAPGANYNHVARHLGNSTNMAFMDGHVQNVANSNDGAGNLTLRPALDAGVFVVKRTD